MAQFNDTKIHGILDAEKYVISKYGYNVAKMNKSLIEFGGDTDSNYKGVNTSVTASKDVQINCGDTYGILLNGKIILDLANAKSAGTSNPTVSSENKVGEIYFKIIS